MGAGLQRAFAAARATNQKPPAYAKVKAAAKREQAKADKLVYQAVDTRDGHRCRLCYEYHGYEIQRAHIVARSLGGPTTTQNVLHLCITCHLVGQHGGRIRLTGNADTRNQFGALSGVHLERLVDGVWRSEGWR